jgi:hypothetical protein
MNWAGWVLIGISVTGGYLVRAWAFPLPVLYVGGWYLARSSGGAFGNHSGSGDNLAALGFYSAAIWCVIGVFLVLAGIAIRLMAQYALRSR